MNSRSFLTSAVAIVAVMVSGTSARAQRVASNATVGVSRQVVQTRAQDSAKGIDKVNGASKTAVRVISGALISGAGMFAGAYAGANMEGPCGCDDPGLEGALLGGLTGMIVGASVGAASPALGSTCSFGERLGRSIVGSLVGSAAGIASISVVHSGAVFLVMPALTAGGAVMFLGPCR